MLRTIFSIGLFTLVGVVLLGVAFTLFGVAAGVAIAVLFVALKVLIIGAIVYGILCIVSPSTARRLRWRFSGGGGGDDGGCC
jgi:hypothetical protein